MKQRQTRGGHLNVVPFPIPRPVAVASPVLCGKCENGYIGVGGVFCIEFREFIDDETVAAECECFEPE